jgi:hypothetical protein
LKKSFDIFFLPNWSSIIMDMFDLEFCRFRCYLDT